MKPAETFFERSFERLSIPFEQFIRKQTTAGIFLILAASLSILLANCSKHNELPIRCIHSASIFSLGT